MVLLIFEIDFIFNWGGVEGGGAFVNVGVSVTYDLSIRLVVYTVWK